MRQTLFRIGKYGLTGGTAAAVDLGVFALLCPAVLAVAPAATASFALAAVVNFTLTSLFVFGTALDLRRFVRFVVFAVLGLGVNVGITVLVAHQLGAAPAWAKLAGIGVAFLFNYWLNATIVFAGSDENAGDDGKVSKQDMSC